MRPLAVWIPQGTSVYAHSSPAVLEYALLLCMRRINQAACAAGVAGM